MTTLLKGIGKLQVSGPAVPDSPTDEDFIKCLDYDELERKFGCFKYYPKFLNNYDYLTPEIREMIGDKPVYLKANKHLKGFKNPGTKKTFVTEIDVETGEMTVKEQVDKKDRKARKEERRAKREDRKERREDRKEDRKERKELKKEQKERRERKKEGKTVQTTLPILQSQHRGRQDSVATGNSGSTQNLGPMGAPAKIEQPNGTANDASNADGFVFNNPFGDQRTLVADKDPKAAPMSRINSVATKGRQNSVHSGVKPRQNSVQTVQNMEKPRKMTFSLRLRDMIMPHKHTANEENTELQRIQSYDQTRLQMTFRRGAKTGLIKNLNSKSRCMSEQFGTYYRERTKTRSIQAFPPQLRAILRERANQYSKSSITAIPEFHQTHSGSPHISI